MIKTYNVYSGRLHIDMVYATSKEHAVDIVKGVWGDPRTYTITGNGEYWAAEA